MALRVHIDETTCGPLCQHPSCWQSNTRQEKGFPRIRPVRPPAPDFDLDLPTLKVCNMLDDYGEDARDLYPSKFGGKQAHERSDLYPQDLYPPFDKPVRTQSVKVTRAPQTSPKSGTATEPPISKFKVVEVQEVFDPEDLQGTWDDTFVPKSYYMWVPNTKKKKRRKKMAKSLQESGMTKLKGKGTVKFKDMTEDMVPKELENTHIPTRKKRSARSPVSIHPYTPRTTRGSTRMELDHEGISELLDLPRDVLVQVLENTRQSDLMSRDRIREIIRRFMPPGIERGNTNISLASQDLLQQKKLNLHEGNKNIRESHLMETKPVFHLDDDIIDDEVDEDMQRTTSPYGSLKDLYLGTGNSRELSKYKKPLPSITGGTRAVSAGQVTQSKIPSISLGLPELPSGIRQTKPFTYSKKADLDFTLGSSAGSRRTTPASTRGPVPTPPTSVRSTGTPGSDHGTTIRVNLPSQTSPRSGNQSDRDRDKHLENRSQMSPEGAIHVTSPSSSMGLPKAPVTTPATYPQSPSKSAPILRDVTSGTSQEWPPTPREKMGSSPLQIMRAPVNTPGSVSQEPSGLHTIHETAGHKEEDEAVHPVSRSRSVRFEIPEVPPPPSSPQLSDAEDEQKEISRNTVTVNTIVPQETPSTSTNKPHSGSFKTDQTTINTSTLQAENSFVKSSTGPIRELSMISSPEPWPQINEADYDVAPVPTPVSQLPETPLETPVSDKLSSEHKSTPDVKSKKTPENLKKSQQETQAKKSQETQAKKSQETQAKKQEDKREPTPEKEIDSEYVNKTGEKTAVVKKMMEESRKAVSPAPPPPSPEAKEDSEIIINKEKNGMTPLLEESDSPGAQDHEVSMTVMQIAPKGPLMHPGKSHHRQIDTFQNIDIPAEFDLEPVHPKLQEPSTETILEEPEPEEDMEENQSARENALSVQSTLANRTISEQAQSDVSISMMEPAISQASQAPALSEDFSENPISSELLGDWTGMIVGSADQDPQAMPSSDQPDMTEEGGDHEGFKEDLRQEYEKITQEIDSEKQDSEQTK